MITTTLKHFLYDIGINWFFDNIKNNFAPAPASYLGAYWMIVDKDKEIVAYGKCIEQKGNLIVLDSSLTEYVVHTELFDVRPLSDDMLTTLQFVDIREAEESEFGTQLG